MRRRTFSRFFRAPPFIAHRFSREEEEKNREKIEMERRSIDKIKRFQLNTDDARLKRNKSTMKESLYGVGDPVSCCIITEARREE